MHETKFFFFSIELNTIEVKKGEDLFSMDKGMLYCELFESFGPKILPIFQPYVLKFIASGEECQQRWASEMVFGLIKGMLIQVHMMAHIFSYEGRRLFFACTKCRILTKWVIKF